MNAPKRELELLEAKAEKEARVLREEYERRVAEMKTDLDRKVGSIWTDIRPKQQQLRELIQNAQNELSSGTRANAEELARYHNKVDFKQMIEIAVPEEFRPKVIEVNGLKKKLYVIQFAIAPKVGVVVNAEGQDSTKWSVTVGPYTTIAKRQHMTCFCGAGCMTPDVHEQTIEALTKVCKENGIEILFGRKVWADHDGIEFRDGGGFEQAMLEYCSKEQLGVMGTYICVG